MRINIAGDYCTCAFPRWPRRYESVLEDPHSVRLGDDDPVIIDAEGSSDLVHVGDRRRWHDAVHDGARKADVPLDPGAKTLAFRSGQRLDEVRHNPTQQTPI